SQGARLNQVQGVSVDEATDQVRILDEQGTWHEVDGGEVYSGDVDVIEHTGSNPADSRSIMQSATNLAGSIARDYRGLDLDYEARIAEQQREGTAEASWDHNAKQTLQMVPVTFTDRSPEGEVIERDGYLGF